MKKLIYLFICFFLANQLVFAQEDQENVYNKKSTLTATLLGFIPGAGHFYLGDYKTGGKFIVTTGLIFAYQNYLRNSKNIIQNTNITFNPQLTLFMNELEDRGYLYQTEEEFRKNPLPRLLLGLELEKEREFRLLRYGQYFPLGILDEDQELYLYEINPLIKYGNYSRQNRETVIYRNINSSFSVDLFYSSYAAYRDSGAYDDSSRQEETFSEVALSPFRWAYFKDWRLTISILVSSVAFGGGFGGSTKIFVPTGEKNYPYLTAFLNNAMYPAIWEEAFFRGVLDHSLSKQIGSIPAALTSAFLFGIIHTYPLQKVGAFFIGSYLSWISRKYNYDIKPGIFVHFWINFLAGVISSQKLVESPYAELNNVQVHSMPVTFYTKAF